mmetsp:Transcript_20182/g.51332  ORF Transcript_20182/g.51332 Transcript_20182/m.51332 type:complete len:95 (+) Transcript_20182:106-390(+)
MIVPAQVGGGAQPFSSNRRYLKAPSAQLTSKLNCAASVSCSSSEAVEGEEQTVGVVGRRAPHLQAGSSEEGEEDGSGVPNTNATGGGWCGARSR